MPAADPRPAPSRLGDRKVTLPQVLALMAIWSAVVYGLTAARPATKVEQARRAPADCVRTFENPGAG